MMNTPLNYSLKHYFNYNMNNALIECRKLTQKPPPDLWCWSNVA